MFTLNIALVAQLFQFTIFGSNLPNNHRLQSPAHSSPLFTIIPDSRDFNPVMESPILSFTIIDIKHKPMDAHIKFLSSDILCDLNIRTIYI